MPAFFYVVDAPDQAGKGALTFCNEGRLTSRRPDRSLIPTDHHSGGSPRAPGKQASTSGRIAEAGSLDEIAPNLLFSVEINVTLR